MAQVSKYRKTCQSLIEAKFGAAEGTRKTAGKYRLYCNLGYNLHEEVVREYFQRFCTRGRILDVYIPRHSSGRNKGYGFTTFQHEGDLENALQRAEHSIDGITVKINRAGPRPDYQPSFDELIKVVPFLEKDQAESAGPQTSSTAFGKGPRLYVGGIPDTITEQQILKHFQRWGTVIDIYFPGKRGQKRVNYCFVTFDDWLAAEHAARETGYRIDGEVVKAISIAEERTILPPQVQSLPPLAHNALLEAQMQGMQLGGYESNLGRSPLAQTQQPLDHSLPLLPWQQQHQVMVSTGSTAGAHPSIADYHQQQLAQQQILLTLQQQQLALQQQRLQQQASPMQEASAAPALPLQPQQPRLEPTSGAAHSQRLLQELRAGVHDLRISPSTNLNIQGNATPPQPQGQQLAAALHGMVKDNPLRELPEGLFTAAGLQDSAHFASFAGHQNAIPTQLPSLQQQEMQAPGSEPSDLLSASSWMRQHQFPPLPSLYGYLDANQEARDLS